MYAQYPPHKRSRLFVFIFAALTSAPSAWAESSQASNDQLDPITVLGQRLSEDEKGQEDVYLKNVSNIYADREYLLRYHTDAAGDILKGLNGVYNMNTRTAGSAITPNIRGVTGKGRIPVTIDGTEQTVDIWMHNYGVGDRNYVDPALFRSIAVEKSPAMTRGIKSSVGGAVSIRTLEADDVVPEGQAWGLNFSGSLANNTITPQNKLGDFLGKDYRTLPGNPTAEGPAMFVNGKPATALFFRGKEKDKPRSRDNSLSNFKNDRSVMFAAGFKTDMVEGLAAYSDRQKGNYFSGKKGANGYLYNPNPNDGNDPRFQTTDAFIPNMAKLYRPGEEVPNSNVASKTLLLKNRWHLPADQQIDLEYMHNDITFGELNPFYNALLLGFGNDYNMLPGQDPYQIAPVQGINSHIDSKTYKIDYSWNPPENKLLDFKASVWHVNTNSERHQSGGPDLNVLTPDFAYDAWVSCNIYNEVPKTYASYGMNCAELSANGMVPKDKPNNPAPIPGAYNVFSGAKQTTIAKRSGLDVSNHFQLRDNLSLTLTGSAQYEKLSEESPLTKNDADMFGLMNAATLMTKFFGPRSGRRHEWGTGLRLDWQPTSRLNVTAGLRYDKFWAFDDATTAGRRAKENPFYSLDMAGGKFGNYIDGFKAGYMEIASEEEIADSLKITEAYNSGDSKLGTHLDNEFRKKYNYWASDFLSMNAAGEAINSIYLKPRPGFVIYAPRAKYSEMRNGQYQGPLFADGQFDEKVHNPQGQKGDFYKYLITEAFQHAKHPLHGSEYTDVYQSFIYNDEVKDRVYSVDNLGGHTYPELNPHAGDNALVYVKKTFSDAWPELDKVRGSAWSPMLALSYDVSDNGRIFARWAKSVRFPSIYEATGISTVNVTTRGAISPEFDLKPERGTSWEIGYAFNFAPYWSALRSGDARITYYDNTIRNVIDTAKDKRIVQFDKKITRGIELQSRLDSGRYYASLGANYRLKQQTCDAATAFIHDIYRNRAPECLSGGYGASRFYQALQPKYSINFDLGTRLLNEKLDLGLRGVYHSSVEQKQQKTLVEQGYWSMLRDTGQPYYWRPSLILDAHGQYQINDKVNVNFSITNLTDRYYLDPMSNVPTPGPGRTFNFGFRAEL